MDETQKDGSISSDVNGSAELEDPPSISLLDISHSLFLFVVTWNFVFLPIFLDGLSVCKIGDLLYAGNSYSSALHNFNTLGPVLRRNLDNLLDPTIEMLGTHAISGISSRLVSVTTALGICPDRCLLHVPTRSLDKFFRCSMRRPIVPPGGSFHRSTIQSVQPLMLPLPISPGPLTCGLHETNIGTLLLPCLCAWTGLTNVLGENHASTRGLAPSFTRAAVSLHLYCNPSAAGGHWE